MIDELEISAAKLAKGERVAAMARNGQNRWHMRMKKSTYAHARLSVQNFERSSTPRIRKLQKGFK